MRFGSFYVQVNNKKEEKTAGIIFHGGNALQFVLEKKQVVYCCIRVPGWGVKLLTDHFFFSLRDESRGNWQIQVAFAKKLCKSA
jgi:hypothetical protein